MQQRGKLITFSRRGHTIHFHNGTCSGYAKPEDFCQPYHWWADPPDKAATHYDNYFTNGDVIPVIDTTRAVETPDGFSWVFKGPIVNVDLEDDEVNPCPQPSNAMLAALLKTEHRVPLVLHMNQKKKEPRALDQVSVKEYVRGWREHGARIGTFVLIDGKSRIDWEEKTQ